MENGVVAGCNEYMRMEYGDEMVDSVSTWVGFVRCVLLVWKVEKILTAQKVLPGVQSGDTMTQNKEKGFYWTEYTCTNCGTKKEVKVPFGESMPILSKNVREQDKQWGIREAPECDYCGCRDWSHGKKATQ